MKLTFGSDVLVAFALGHISFLPEPIIRKEIRYVYLKNLVFIFPTLFENFTNGYPNPNV